MIDKDACVQVCRDLVAQDEFTCSVDTPASVKQLVHLLNAFRSLAVEALGDDAECVTMVLRVPKDVAEALNDMEDDAVAEALARFAKELTSPAG